MSRSSVTWLAAAALVTVTGAVAWWALGGDEEELPHLRTVIEDLANVDTTLYALDSVWAVTSELPDGFSLGSADASVVLIDPSTGETRKMLGPFEAEPALSAAGGRVWADIGDRLVAFDEFGSEVASVPLEGPTAHAAGERYLWIVDFLGASASAVDVETATIVKTFATGASPVAPIWAFGRMWIPSAVDGTVTIIDEAALDEPEVVLVGGTGRLTDVTAVPGDGGDDEVWVTNLDGELYAIDAEDTDVGTVRRIMLDAAINRVVPFGSRVFLLPTWGRSVLVSDRSTDELLATIEIGTIPFRAVAAHDRIWVAGDGLSESVTVIDPVSLAVERQIAIGTNDSNTTGPVQPVVLGNEVWIPNRGDDSIFVIAAGS